ncbi:hypothetical protein CBR_g19402 [Chara braunii]|uniref:TFIIS N-terminal domain-containing protein n=1 Tax=Chara braunii TaxID=69332 RepID=A0A388KXU9_CHABU|nr:hypothetical protein CBR_g19402 [Chara braunii]|eukprot:GBG74889.1 hypothetical protein CBR_g19402 [Chara braunii]
MQELNELEPQLLAWVRSKPDLQMVAQLKALARQLSHVVPGRYRPRSSGDSDAGSADEPATSVNAAVAVLRSLTRVNGREDRTRDNDMRSSAVREVYLVYTAHNSVQNEEWDDHVEGEGNSAEKEPGGLTRGRRRSVPGVPRPRVNLELLEASQIARPVALLRCHSENAVSEAAEKLAAHWANQITKFFFLCGASSV